MIGKVADMLLEPVNHSEPSSIDTHKLSISGERLTETVTSSFNATMRKHY